jgi:predicted methyltransferase
VTDDIERHAFEAAAAQDTISLIQKAIADSGRPASPTTQDQLVVFGERVSFHRRQIVGLQLAAAIADVGKISRGGFS